MCPEESAIDTIEFKNYYVIVPYAFDYELKFSNFKISKNKEKGKPVKKNRQWFNKGPYLHINDTGKHIQHIKI